MSDPAIDRPRVAAVILAAGASTRMGRPKQLLPFRGRPLLQHAVDAALASMATEVILVLGHQAGAVASALAGDSPSRLRVIINADYRRGQGSSLVAGLRATNAEAVAAAILLGDQPGVTAGLIDRVVGAFLETRAPILRPVYFDSGGTRVPGHPVLLARSLWPALEAEPGLLEARPGLLDVHPELVEGLTDHGARALIALHPEWVVELPIEGEPPPDIDTWGDYESLQS